MLVFGFEPFCCISFRLETSFIQYRRLTEVWVDVTDAF